MEKVKFCDIELSKLGFGCTRLTANFSEKSAISNLNTAFDGGVTHFDVARVYGFGMAESILGKFVADKRNNVTIATKIGILPSQSPLNNLFLLNVVRAGFDVFPFLKKKIAGNLQQELVFSPKEADRSLETSLQALGTDFVDILFLHESSMMTANRLDVVGFLETKVKQGKIRQFGIASHFNKLPQDFSMINPSYKVIQYEAEPFMGKKYSNQAGRLISSHSLFRQLPSLIAETKCYPFLVKSLSDTLGTDMSIKDNLVKFIVQHAREQNPNGIILFSTKNNRKIKANIQHWNTSTFSQSQIKTAILILENHFEKLTGEK
jgi:diketogulonate reductase-like aldo/keto reductase